MWKKDLPRVFFGAVFMILVGSRNTAASDDMNLCFFDPHPTSENISLPEDDGFHYPSQWTGDPNKVNWTEPLGALESMWKTWSWTAYPKRGGEPVKLEGFIMFAAAYIQSPFENGELGWVRLLVSGFLGLDGVYHHHLYFAPGEFSPNPNGQDLFLGGPDETAVLEVMDDGSYVPVDDPSLLVGEVYGSGGSESVSYFTSDGIIALSVHDESIKRPSYPFDDGYSELWKYYWARPMMTSHGDIVLDGVAYHVIGTAWEEREWDFNVPDLSALYQERHINIQIMGCLDRRGRKIPCEHSLRTILVFDIRFKEDHSHAIHDWEEFSPPPFCDHHKLTEPSDWSATPLEYFVSSRTGIQYARKVRLTAPSRGVDLIVEAVVDEQEVYKTMGLFPGWYEGSAELSGTIGGKRVWGNAFLEAFNYMP